jgi:hypothetical protein
MSAKVWWPLFPLLLVIVITCLITTLVRLPKGGKPARKEWMLLSSALFFYILTFALGRWRPLHMFVSDIAEILIAYNAGYFRNRKDITRLNLIALAAILADFALHYILQ